MTGLDPVIFNPTFFCTRGEKIPLFYKCKHPHFVTFLHLKKMSSWSIFQTQVDVDFKILFHKLEVSFCKVF